ncbi:MAG: MT-A70 family methyltransferase [Gaiellaceae bacterium]
MERKRLDELEAVVKRGLETFVEVGLALQAIRDERLYCEHYPSFEEYLAREWSLGRSTGYGLIDAARVAANVSPEGHSLSLSHLRALAPLDRDGQRTLAPVISAMTVADARRVIREWRAQNRKDFAELEPPPLPSGTFRTIHCDPPWSWEADYGDGLAHDRYRCLSLEEIIALPVPALAAPDSHLYLWVPGAKIADGLRVIEAWGFTYRTQLVWVKPRGLGLGTWFRMGTEPLLFATRGRLKTRGTDIRNWFEAPRGRHSAKPDEAISLIEKASPGPYLDLYGRKQRGADWTVWGDEVG